MWTRSSRRLLLSTSRRYHYRPTLALASISGYATLGVAGCERHAIVSYPTRRTRPPPILVTTWAWNEVQQRLCRYWRMFWRLLKLSFTLAPVTLFYPLLLFLHPTDEHSDAHQVVLAADKTSVDGLLGWYLRLCLHCVEWSGAAVIKLMQWAGSRPDMFGGDFCAVFSQLQDATTPHAWRHTRRALQEAYGEDWERRIRLGEILGSGCIGQVYRGYLLDDHGNEAQQVAVKVLHPNVEADIDADLDLMRVAVRGAQLLPFDVFANLKWLNLEGVVEEFASLLKLQLDLRNEAVNLQRFNHNFANVHHIQFPQLVPGHAPTRNLLVETYCDGVPVLQYARENRSNPAALHQMCLSAIRAVCKMIFLDNFMHGDLHPGNVFVSRDGSKFILFDVGIVAEYSDKDHETIVDVLSAFIRKQGRVAGRRMIDDSDRRGDRAVDTERYLDKIEALTIRASSADYFMEHLGTYISYICDAAAKHHVMMNPSFISAALAVKVQEGIALALDPSIEICSVAIPIIVESERRRYVANAKNKVKSLFGLS